MSDDFGQSIQGLHLDGDSIVSTDQHIAIFGKTNTSTYTYLALDANGQLELAHDVNTNAVFTHMTDGTDDLNIYNEGDASDTGIGIMGEDSAGTMQFLKVTPSGELIINIGAADSAYLYGSATAIKATAGTVVTESPSVTTKYIGVIVTGLGLAEWEVKFGVTLSEATVFGLNTTPSHPTEKLMFPAPLEVVSGETILVEVTNRENAASPASDFTAKATLIKEA